VLAKFYRVKGLVMSDLASARLSTHRNNIARYRRLLETNLTEFEREYIARRLSEEQANLEAVVPMPHNASNIAAAY
jgi:hypothetical protein